MMSYEDLGAPQSRNEAILMNMLGATYEIGSPQSRIEYLLTEILENGGGGGGGGTTNYNALSNKPKINDVELSGDKSLADLGIDVDSALSTTSEKAVQNKVVTLALNEKLGISSTIPAASVTYLGKQLLYVGTTTSNYTKGVIYECQSTGGSSYAWVAISKATYDSALSTTSENAPQNKVVTLALNEKLGIAATMPTASATYENKQLLYVGATDATYTKGMIYECQNDSGVYSWVSISASSIEVDAALSTTSENPVQNKVVTGALNKRLVIADNMPTAASALEGQQRIYVGATDINYTKGNIYECIEVLPATDPKTYAWIVINKAFVDVDSALSTVSENPVQNKIITAALEDKLTMASSIPAASASNEGVIYLYTGVSTQDFAKGYLYQSQEITPATDPKTYHWVCLDAVSIEVDDALSTTSEHPVQNKVVTAALNQRLVKVTSMPTADATNEGEQVIYVGATDANYTKGMIYESQEILPATDPKTYQWVCINDVPIEIDNALSTTSEHPVQNKVITLALNGKLDKTDTMPAAASTNEGSAYLYIGATDANYTKGMIYECQEITPATDPKTYHWVCINDIPIVIDAALSTTSEHPVQNKVMTGALNERLIVTDTMPTASADIEGFGYIYIGASNVNYTKGNIYKCVEVIPATDPKTYAFEVVNKADIDLSKYKTIFLGTSDEWELLTDAQKSEYDCTAFTNDNENYTTISTERYVISVITIPNISYTADTEYNQDIDISSYLPSGYKAVGVLGFNIGVSKAICRRMFVYNGTKLSVSITTPTNVSSDMIAHILCEKS